MLVEVWKRPCVTSRVLTVRDWLWQSGRLRKTAETLGGEGEDVRRLCRSSGAPRATPSPLGNQRETYAGDQQAPGTGLRIRDVIRSGGVNRTVPGDFQATGGGE